MYGRYVGMYCTVAVNVKRYICVSNKNTAWRDGDSQDPGEYTNRQIDNSIGRYSIRALKG